MDQHELHLDNKVCNMTAIQVKFKNIILPFETRDKWETHEMFLILFFLSALDSVKVHHHDRS